MNDEPKQDAPQGAAPDSLDDTQRVEVPRYAPTPDPRPDARWAWASPGTQPTSERWYEPVPAESPPAYSTPSWGQPAPGAASPPLPAYAASTAPIQQRRRGGAGVGSVVAASLLSAILASGGTVLVLERTGAFDDPVPTSGASTAQPVAGQLPVTINESSAIIDAAERVGPAVVKITTGGTTSTEDPFGGGFVEGVGSGFIYDANGWILTEASEFSLAGGCQVVIEVVEPSGGGDIQSPEDVEEGGLSAT